MRLLAAKITVALAMSLGAVAISSDWSSTAPEVGESTYDWLVASSGYSSSGDANDGFAAAIATVPYVRCPADQYTDITSTSRGRLSDLVIDGCNRGWPPLFGTLRLKGDIINDFSGQCERSKQHLKATGKDGNDTATIVRRRTQYGEESRFAYSEAGTAKFNDEKFEASSRTVLNVFYNTTNGDEKGFFDMQTRMCPTGAALLPAGNASRCLFTPASEESGSIRFDLTCWNPTNETYKNVKAMLTFDKQIELVKAYRPKGSPRNVLPSVGSSKDAPGALVNVTEVNLPLASKTLPSKGLMEGSYVWEEFAGLNQPIVGTNATLTLMNGKDVLYTEKVVITVDN